MGMYHPVPHEEYTPQSHPVNPPTERIPRWNAINSQQNQVPQWNHFTAREDSVIPLTPINSKSIFDGGIQRRVDSESTGFGQEDKPVGETPIDLINGPMTSPATPPLTSSITPPTTFPITPPADIPISGYIAVGVDQPVTPNTTSSTPTKRPRGRTRKDGSWPKARLQAQPKPESSKKRGRPKKPQSLANLKPKPVPGRGRGRPKKKQAPIGIFDSTTGETFRHPSSLPVAGHRFDANSVTTAITSRPEERPQRSAAKAHAPYTADPLAEAYEDRYSQMDYKGSVLPSVEIARIRYATRPPAPLTPDPDVSHSDEDTDVEYTPSRSPKRRKKAYSGPKFMTRANGLAHSRELLDVADSFARTRREGTIHVTEGSLEWTIAAHKCSTITQDFLNAINEDMPDVSESDVTAEVDHDGTPAPIPNFGGGFPTTLPVRTQANRQSPMVIPTPKRKAQAMEAESSVLLQQIGSTQGPSRGAPPTSPPSSAVKTKQEQSEDRLSPLKCPADGKLKTPSRPKNVDVYMANMDEYYPDPHSDTTSTTKKNMLTFHIDPDLIKHQPSSNTFGRSENGQVIGPFFFSIDSQKYSLWGRVATVDTAGSEEDVILRVSQELGKPAPDYEKIVWEAESARRDAEIEAIRVQTRIFVEAKRRAEVLEGEEKRRRGILRAARARMRRSRVG